MPYPRNLILLSVLSLCMLFTVKGDLAAAPGVSGHVYTQAAHKQTSARAPMIDVTLGKAEVIMLNADIGDVMVANPSVIDVVALKKNQLYIVGAQLGDTNIIALDDAGDVVARFNVHVHFDLDKIRGQLRNVFPDEHIMVEAVGAQLLMRGTVSTPQVAGQVARLVSANFAGASGSQGAPDELLVNMLQVRGEQQVMLRVRVIEASRSVLKELGVGTSFDETGQSTVNVLGGDLTGSFSTLAGAALTGTPFSTTSLLFDTGLRGIGTIDVAINALEENNLVNILAEPNLTAVSGQEAGFQAGGDFPVPSGLDDEGNIQITYRPFGVALNFRPRVLSEGRISLQLDTEVSSIDNSEGITLSGGTRVPGFDVRKASTTVELGSGGSLMIAGLLQSETLKGLSGLPGLSDTPVISDLMSSDSFTRNETELVVIVTPYLVTPYADDQQARRIELPHSKVLANAFIANMQRRYDVDEIDALRVEEGVGYILD